MSFKTDNGGCVSPECLPGQNRDIKQDQRQKTDEIDESLMEELVKFLEEYFDQNSLRESDPAIGDDLNNLVNDEDNSGSGTSRQKRNLLTDLIQPHMDEMWEGHDPEGDREAYEWMQSVGWENIKPVIQRLVDGLRAERERMKTRLLFMTIYQLLLTFSNKVARQSFGNLGETRLQMIMNQDIGLEVYEAILEDRRQKTDETDENLKEALKRLLEEYLHPKSQGGW